MTVHARTKTGQSRTFTMSVEKARRLQYGTWKFRTLFYLTYGWELVGVTHYTP